VRDCAEGLVVIAECDALVGDIVNLGYGEETTVSDLAKLILEAVGRTDLRPIFDSERPGDVPRLKVDSTKLRGATSFVPRTPLLAGLHDTVAYYKTVFARQPDCLAQMQIRNWEVA
jgi:nucleoside-diphosphate-sugar epimerase